MNKIKTFITSVFCLLIAGCENNTIDFYADKKAKVDLRAFLNGPVEGWGALFDYQGRQTRSFTVTMKGTWTENKGILEEWFEFDDGEKTERVWDIHFVADQVFVAKAKDVVEDANGSQRGNAINMHYTLQVPYNGKTIDLNMNDWMYKIADGIILNRTTMKKFGFKVGEIVLFMKKKS